MVSPWRHDGDWLRCALHTHTTNSDGELTPRALARHYERAGYDVLALTDHWHRSEAPTSDRLLVLAGAELNCLLSDGRDGHVLALGLESELSTLEGERRDLAATADWIVAAGGVAFLAHPYWTGVVPGRLELPSSVSGIEVFNAGCELEIGRGLSSVHWDELLVAGRSCAAIAADDSHHPGFDSDYAWTWVRGERSREGVLEALRTGRFYASTGPLVTAIEIETGSVVARCSPCRSVTLLTGVSSGAAVNAGRLGYRHAADVLEQTPDGWITTARLDLPEMAPYARLEVVDPAGRRAWTNPLWPA